MENKIANKTFWISLYYTLFYIKNESKKVSKCFLFHITSGLTEVGEADLDEETCKVS